MKKLILAGAGLILALGTEASPKKHRHHEAHVHGAATLQVAFDGLKGKVEFKGASEGVVGFEHEAKSERDKKKVQEVSALFESEISRMIKFEDSRKCQFTKEKIEMVAERDSHEESKQEGHQGEHSDFVANFSVLCAEPLKGTKVTFDFTRFKRLKEVEVTFLLDDIQKSTEVKKKPVILILN